MVKHKMKEKMILLENGMVVKKKVIKVKKVNYKKMVKNKKIMMVNVNKILELSHSS